MRQNSSKANSGFTQIPNQILEFLYSKEGRVINASDRAVFDVLLRFSIGFQGDKSKSIYAAKISHSFIAQATGLARTNVTRSMKKLYEIQWVQKVRKGLYHLLILECINNDTFADSSNVSIQIDKGIKSDNKIVSNQIPNKEIKKTIKESSSNNKGIIDELRPWKPL